MTKSRWLSEKKKKKKGQNCLLPDEQDNQKGGEKKQANKQKRETKTLRQEIVFQECFFFQSLRLFHA